MKNDMAGTPHAPPAARPDTWPVLSGLQALVLLLEYDDDNRELLKLLFESSGFEVAECRYGDSAIETIRQLQPDLVIMNGRLPGEDGWSVCRRLRAAETGIRQMPVILVSASGDRANQARALSVGCTLYFDEPFNVREVLLAAEALVARRHQMQ